jgi:hypothetical protein
VRLTQSQTTSRCGLQLGLLLHDLFGDLDDTFRHVESLLGTDLKPLDVILLEECQVLLRDGRTLPLVALVDEAIDAILGRVLLGLLHPVTQHVLEGLPIRYIVHQNHRIGALVVRLGYPAEALLTSSVPDLQLNVVLLDVHGPA